MKQSLSKLSLQEEEVAPAKKACDDLLEWLEENGESASVEEIKAKQKETEEVCLPLLQKSMPEPATTDHVD